MIPQVAAHVAGYRLDALVGRGGGGVVYRATHLRLDTIRALKLLAPELAADEGFRRRFETEAKLAASLRHPHIVPVHDAGEADGLLYLAMHFVDGPDLASMIRADGPLGLRRTCDILGQIASALDTAHRAGLVHRDVKPANILLERGRPDHAYLADFGLTRRLESSSLTSGMVAGTFAYMAPERFRAGGPPQAAVDVYALGCVAYVCLSGAPPFGGDTFEAVMAAHMFAPPPSLCAADPAIQPAIDAVLARATAKNPAARYPSCGAFVDALRAAAAEPRAPTLATSPLPGTQAERTWSDVARPPEPEPGWWRRRRMALGGVLLGALVGAAVLSAVVDHGDAPRPAVAGPEIAPAALATRLGPDLNALAMDAAGDLYVATLGDDRVQKLTPSGTLRTVAGGNGAGFSGDGGPAVAARLDQPAGLAVDAVGDLYIADRANNRVRRVDATGTISTFAGTGDSGSDGDGGQARQADLQAPVDVTVAGGDLYVVEAEGNRVRRIDASGRISTVVGTGTAGDAGDSGPAAKAELNNPAAITVSAGSLYIADRDNHRVRRVDPSGTITTVAGDGERGSDGDGGVATSAELQYPNAVAIDAAGTLYLTDFVGQRVRRVDANGVITTVAGTGAAGFSGDGGPSTQAQLAFPSAVLIGPDGAIYVGDADNERVRRIGPDSTITTVAGNGPDYPADGTPATQAFLLSPEIAQADRAGALYIADDGDHRRRRVDASGVITTIAGTGIAGYTGDAGPATAARLNRPTGLAIDSVGNVYVADSENHCVRKVAPDGTITTMAGIGRRGYSEDGGRATGSELDGPVDVAVDRAGNVYVAELNTSRVRRIDPAGTLTTVAGTGTAGYSGDGGPAVAAKLSGPTGVHIAPDGTLYITDRGSDTVRRIDSAGIITTVAGNGTEGFTGDGKQATATALTDPSTSAVDTAGNLYIADAGNHRVRKVDTEGTITTVAGTGTSGVARDGNLAVRAQLARPVGVSIDRAGRLYVTDYDFNLVYAVGTDGVITRVAGVDY